MKQHLRWREQGGGKRPTKRILKVEVGEVETQEQGYKIVLERQDFLHICLNDVHT